MSLSSRAPLLFFRSLVDNPGKVGALAPSSPKLSELMAATVHPNDFPVLEIGAGTGSITRALLRRGLAPERFYVIERDPTLAAFLQQRFPGVQVRCAEAVQAKHILSAESV